ncbi:MAG: HEPN domain-containing protein [Planctomycetes bacterium]|nr:HEPN domain-containing protein [Planctomycetota bacterium]
MPGSGFLDTAKLIIAHGTEDFDYRSVVSRAYYACFLTLRELAFENCDSKIRIKAGIKKSENVGHLSLLSYLNESSDGSVKKTWKFLRELQAKRIESDYKLARKPFTIQNAEDAIAFAEKILELIYKIPAAKIGEAMAKYIERMYGKR